MLKYWDKLFIALVVVACVSWLIGHRQGFTKQEQIIAAYVEAGQAVRLGNYFVVPMSSTEFNNYVQYKIRLMEDKHDKSN